MFLVNLVYTTDTNTHISSKYWYIMVCTVTRGLQPLCSSNKTRSALQCQRVSVPRCFCSSTASSSLAHSACLSDQSGGACRAQIATTTGWPHKYCCPTFHPPQLCWSSQTGSMNLCACWTCEGLSEPEWSYQSGKMGQEGLWLSGAKYPSLAHCATRCSPRNPVMQPLYCRTTFYQARTNMIY